MSYDGVDLLEQFADRAGITFPLLADPRSKAIKAFGIVNTQVPEDNAAFGFAYAGYYLIDAEGVVTKKFFNEANNDRTTASNILIRQFDAKPGQVQGQAKTKHLTMDWSASSDELRPGQRAALLLDIDLKPRMHLYAPGEHRYIAVEWTMTEMGGIQFLDPEFPQSETMHLRAIKESVPVYHGKLRLIRDVHLMGGRTLDEALEGRVSIEITGQLRYQACDEERCYFPKTIPLKWNFDLSPHDLTRTPEELRRGAPR